MKIGGETYANKELLKKARFTWLGANIWEREKPLNWQSNEHDKKLHEKILSGDLRVVK